MQFKILKKSKKSRARIGVIKTGHGVLHTPAFFPVATQACLKTLTSEDIQEIGFEGILCNTYHLMLRPGSALIKGLGGLHKFMNFPGVIATDSGGFQIFSLGKGLEQKVGKIIKANPETSKIEQKRCLIQLQNKEKEKGQSNFKDRVKIREEGVYFKSHIDGKEHFLSPEKSIQIQQEMGADIVFAFDECTSPLDDFESTKKAMERTHCWAIRCLQAANSPISNLKSQISKPNLKTKNLKNNKPALFGIVQGGKYKNLRVESAKFIGSLDFDGFGIGGSFGDAHGDSKTNMFQAINWIIPLLAEEKPKHLLGIGHLNDLEKAIERGIDLFDCVYPARMARHGIAITSKGNINMQKAFFLNSKSPLDKKCSCFVCKNYFQGYICHLFRAKEMSAFRFLTFHNLWFFRTFIENIRQKIARGKI